MLGWLNLSIEAFITDTFGPEKWQEVVAISGVRTQWVSSCPYSDKVTYDIVKTAADLLGVEVNDALEAYGLYFVQHVADQGYTKMLHVLGSNVAEFLQNLNNLHLHLSTCWPSMVAPGFRCEKVTPESLYLHYYSSRPGLWPVVVGVLKGVAREYFNLDLQIELVQSRGAGDCDHEVFILRYPYQDKLSDWDCTEVASKSVYSMPHDLFYKLHPFHLLIDESCQVVQWGMAIPQVAPDLKKGDALVQHFRIRHPYIHVNFDAIVLNSNSGFLLMGRDTSVTLKGQMVLTGMTDPETGEQMRALLYLASPRCQSLQEMQKQQLFLSDIPIHDMSRDYILLAEQRQAEANLKDKFEKLTVELTAANEKLAKTTAWLEEEKARAEALLYRMSGLIACFPDGPGDKQQQQQGSRPQGQGQRSILAQMQPHMKGGSICDSMMSKESTTLDRIEAVRRELAKANIGTGDTNQIECMELLGEGTYGKVYKGLWKGTVVAVKTIVLPAVMSGAEKREKMAIMEAAISTALSHPNIMCTYTYDIHPIRDSSRPEAGLMLLGSTTSGTTVNKTVGTTLVGSNSSNDQGVHSYEVRLVLEYCDKGSLRDALDGGAFFLEDGSVNYCAVLDTAIDLANAMIHLHTRNVLHSDLKARNIMLKSSGSEGRGVVAKVADFGLSVKMDHMETHLSNAFQGTMTHMAPEIMIKGHISKAADVYAFGMVLWEIYTGKHVFKGVPRALLGHQITLENKRPEFPANTPEGFVALAKHCWDPDPAKRPVLEVVLERLQQMRLQQHAITGPLGQYKVNKVVPSGSTGGRAGEEGSGRAGERSVYLDQTCSTSSGSGGYGLEAHSDAEH